MTIGIFTILATTGLLVLLKLGIMALVVVLLTRTLSSDKKNFEQRSAIAVPVINETHR